MSSHKSINSTGSKRRIPVSTSDSQVAGLYSRPEYDAARYGPGLTFEEFRAWYPVALKISKGSVAADEMTETACQEAFEIYERCATDFY